MLYCESPGETISTRGALVLATNGFTRVAVLAGGFEAWLEGNLPLERTPHAKTGFEARALQARPPAPPGMQRPFAAQTRVDLPLGVKGSGPYSNACTTSLGVTGLSFSAAQGILVGQRLHLTVFTEGDALEMRGVVEAVHTENGATVVSPSSAKMVEVRLDPLPDEIATALEGLILSRRTMRSKNSSGEERSPIGDHYRYLSVIYTLPPGQILANVFKLQDLYRPE